MFLTKKRADLVQVKITWTRKTSGTFRVWLSVYVPIDAFKLSVDGPVMESMGPVEPPAAPCYIDSIDSIVL